MTVASNMELGRSSNEWLCFSASFQNPSPTKHHRWQRSIAQPGVGLLEDWTQPHGHREMQKLMSFTRLAPSGINAQSSRLAGA